MLLRRLLLTVFFTILPALVLTARAADSTPEETLAAKGLHKFNLYFALAEEADTSKKLHELETLKRTITLDQQKEKKAEKKVEDKKKQMVEMLEQRTQLRAMVDGARTAEQQARAAHNFNSLTDQYNIMLKKDDEEKDAKAARAALAGVTDQYVDTLLKLRVLHDQVEQEYKKLAADPQVTQAIEDFNKDSPKPFKLGPSSSFTLLGANLAKLEGGVLTDTITMRHGDGNLWHLTVTFNGSKSEDFAVDTGASVIALPYQTAVAVGLQPSPSDEKIQVSLADGHLVTATKVTARSVRIGKFVVENVECAVMEEGLPNAEPLLGLSFLKHFTFKIDSANGKLFLSEIDSSAKSGKTAVASSGSQPATAGDPPAAETPTIETPAAPVADVSEKLAKLLAVEGAEAKELVVQLPGQGAIHYHPCKHGPVESLIRRYGMPDEIIKAPPSGDIGGEPEAGWKVWSWGTVKILVDEGGKTRYFAKGE